MTNREVETRRVIAMTIFDAIDDLGFGWASDNWGLKNAIDMVSVLGVPQITTSDEKREVVLDFPSENLKITFGRGAIEIYTINLDGHDTYEIHTWDATIEAAGNELLFKLNNGFHTVLVLSKDPNDGCHAVRRRPEQMQPEG